MYTDNYHIYHARQFKPDVSANQRISILDYNACDIRFDWVAIVKNSNLGDDSPYSNQPYPTNPLCADTDSDGMDDNYEIGYSENNKDTYDITDDNDCYNKFSGGSKWDSSTWDGFDLEITHNDKGVQRYYFNLLPDIYDDSTNNIDKMYINEYQYLSFRLRMQKELDADDNEPFSQLFLLVGYFDTSEATNKIDYKVINFEYLFSSTENSSEKSRALTLGRDFL